MSLLTQLRQFFIDCSKTLETLALHDDRTEMRVYLLLNIENDRCHVHTGIGSDGHIDVHCFVSSRNVNNGKPNSCERESLLSNRFVHPDAVRFRSFLACQCCCFDDEVVHGDILRFNLGIFRFRREHVVEFFT